MIEYHPLSISEKDHRFALEQSGDHMLFVIGINPSTADEKKPDPTMQSVLRFINAYGYDGFVMMNLSSERAKDPNNLSVTLDEKMHRINVGIISELGERYPSADVLLAFGNNIDKRVYLEKCFYDIYQTLKGKRKWLSIGGMAGVTKYGHPRHPLHASTKLGLGAFDIEKYASHCSYGEGMYNWYMEVTHRSSSPDPEWRWCLVGNIVKSHPFGEDGEERSGTKQFAPGTKVYVAPANWGDGYEHVIVIGHPRRGKQLIQIVMPFNRIENFRVQKVFKPAVLEIMKQGLHVWWNNTNEDYEKICTLIHSIYENSKKH